MQIQAIYNPRKIATQTIEPQGNTLVQTLVACSPQARKLVDGNEILRLQSDQQRQEGSLGGSKEVLLRFQGSPRRS